MDDVPWRWIQEVWTWIYIIPQDIWFCILLWVVVQHGKLKLGKDVDGPEFSTATRFSMLFCCGVATGLFYYAVAEPISRVGSARGFCPRSQGCGSVDEDATHAPLVSVFQ
ncbi:unnamed protein product [Prorocentrum cordatum]|uniref:Glycerophosphocholine acyltransferase 1 n=1 Tax=Prorocentrum cordatum TaxID=2364126 RepID=A0ABN9QID5_9DINO|nr:unnamed protein product [Polarella glacialis]